MSSHDSINMVFKCMLKGAADFLVKPIRKNELGNLWQHVWRRHNNSSDDGHGGTISAPLQHDNAKQKLELWTQDWSLLIDMNLGVLHNLQEPFLFLFLLQNLGVLHKSDFSTGTRTQRTTRVKDEEGLPSFALVNKATSSVHQMI